MWVDLRDNEMVDVEHLSQPDRRDVIVDRSIDQLASQFSRSGDLASRGVFDIPSLTEMQNQKIHGKWCLVYDSCSPYMHRRYLLI